MVNKILMLVTLSCLIILCLEAKSQILLNGVFLNERLATTERELSEPLRVGDEMDTMLVEKNSWHLIKQMEVKTKLSRYLFCLYEWPGNCASLVVFKKEMKFRVLGGYTNCFGGNGIVFEIEKLVPRKNQIKIALRSTGFTRGYYADPNREETYVAPRENVSHLTFLLNTQGDKK